MPTLLAHPAVPPALGFGLGRAVIPRPLLAGVAIGLARRRQITASK